MCLASKYCVPIVIIVFTVPTNASRFESSTVHAYCVNRSDRIVPTKSSTVPTPHRSYSSKSVSATRTHFTLVFDEDERWGVVHFNRTSVQRFREAVVDHLYLVNSFVLRKQYPKGPLSRFSARSAD
jgi:hypothetical protein